MKKFKAILLGFCAMLVLTAVSCSRNDHEETQPDNTVKLEGTWKLNKVDFKGDGINWNPAVPFNAGTGFAFAPFMFKDVRGFKFGTKKVASDIGYRFDYQYAVNHGEDPNNEHWYWNYNGDKTGFEIKQINPAYPPYNFSILDITNIKKSNNGDKIIFDAMVNSRVPGQSITTTVLVPVELTMERGTPDKDPELYHNGAPYVFPN